MDTKIKIKEEHPLTDDIASQNETQLLTQIMKPYGDAVFLDNDGDMPVETEDKPDTILPDLCLQTEGEFLPKYPIEQINSESVTYINCEVNSKTDMEEQTLFTDFSSQNKWEFLQEDPELKVEKANNGHEMANKTEIKQEFCWLKTENLAVCDEIKVEEFPPVISPRSSLDSIPGVSSCKSQLSSAEYLRKDNAEYADLRNSKHQGSCITENQLDQPSKHSIGEKTSSLIQNHVIQEGKKPYGCGICERRFTRLSNLKLHSLIHEGKRPYKCESCQKSFTQLQCLKAHNLIHGGKRPYKCQICEKSFLRLIHLKSHHLIHEGKKPHKCEICEKRFTQLVNLKSHKLIHEGTKPYKCHICQKRFTGLTTLKSHVLIHEGKKPHRCEICEKKFTYRSSLKKHNLIHEGKKPYKCEICEKRFTALNSLKVHILCHTGKKPHKCDICEKSFTTNSNLSSHKLIHEGKKPYKCEICENRFNRRSSLKRHNFLIHEGKKPHIL